MNNNLDNIKTTWQGIEQTAKEIKLPDNDITSQVKLNQLIDYIKTLLNSCNINLLPISANQKIITCSNSIADLKNGLITIDGTYDILHDIILCIFPYVPNKDDTSLATIKTINKYHNIVKNYIKVIEDKEKVIDSLDLENKKLVISQIEDYHAKLFTNENPIETQITQAQEICNNFKSNYDSIKSQIEEIQKYRSEIFDENGIEQKIKDILIELEKKQLKIQYLTEEADKILIKATNAGLARAYSALQKLNKYQVWGYTAFFSLLVMVWGILSIYKWNDIVDLLNQQKDFISWAQALITRFLLLTHLTQN